MCKGQRKMIKSTSNMYINFQICLNYHKNQQKSSKKISWIWENFRTAIKIQTRAKFWNVWLGKSYKTVLNTNNEPKRYNQVNKSAAKLLRNGNKLGIEETWYNAFYDCFGAAIKWRQDVKLELVLISQVDLPLELCTAVKIDDLFH